MYVILFFLEESGGGGGIFTVKHRLKHECDY